MNITLVILIVEICFVLLGGVGFLLFFRWKQKKNKISEFEKLLDNVSAKEDERKTKLIQLLQEKYAVENNDAKELAAYMIEAEQQFVQQFLNQQIRQTPVIDFYHNLCELLDQYAYFIPGANGEMNISKRVQPEQEVVVNIDDKVVKAIAGNGHEKENKVSEVVEETHDTTDKKTVEVSTEVSESKSSDDTRIESKNGTSEEIEGENELQESKEDGLTESSVEGSVNKEKMSDSNAVEEVEEAEPDWGEAFSESGDSVDEDVKAEYEAEQQKG